MDALDELVAVELLGPAVGHEALDNLLPKPAALLALVVDEPSDVGLSPDVGPAHTPLAEEGEHLGRVDHANRNEVVLERVGVEVERRKQGRDHVDVLNRLNRDVLDRKRPVSSSLASVLHDGHQRHTSPCWSLTKFFLRSMICAREPSQPPHRSSRRPAARRDPFAP
jgi:hypothetical protein